MTSTAIAGRFGPRRAVPLNMAIRHQSGISPEMALRLSKALGRTPQSQLAMQDSYDLWHAGKNIKLDKVHKVELTASSNHGLQRTPKPLRGMGSLRVVRLLSMRKSFKEISPRIS